MTTLGLATIKAQSMAKDAEEKRQDNREKAMLLFAFQLLLDKGYVETATSLASECSLNLEQYALCENIDLRTVFIDYEAYYNMRFQKYPQYFKKVAQNGGSVGEGLLTKLAREQKNKRQAKPSPSQRPPGGAIPEAESCRPEQGDIREIRGHNCIDSAGHDKLLKPISGLSFPNEDMRYFAEMIQRDIIVNDLETKWDDVVGLEQAKMILMESLLYKNYFSEFFGNSLPPWRGLLLYGPVGTGKTLLARAVASECGTTFFNISSSTLVSKWRGDSEKIVKVLFELARFHAPSTIFFDEFDALASNRDNNGESDAARRLKSELLQQMDGLISQVHQDKQVFVLAATNLPWELDPAVIRRLDKRVHVPLPNAEERQEIIKLYFEKTMRGVIDDSKGRNSLICRVDFEAFATATEGYSGSDLQQVVKESVVQKFRKTFSGSGKLRQLVIENKDVAQALRSVTPTVKADMDKKFKAWESSFTSS